VRQDTIATRFSHSADSTETVAMDVALVMGTTDDPWLDLEAATRKQR